MVVVGTKAQKGRAIPAGSGEIGAEQRGEFIQAGLNPVAKSWRAIERSRRRVELSTH
ncbi:hypothetical protein [Nocardia sp. NPDC060249]|uniref:hypothetical protein n=1 Tax=Nocardia sp. NPDC060249 TaxID=3347082 RepID=UPI00365AE9EF